MQLWTDEIDPAEITEFSRTIVEERDTSIFAQILPNFTVPDIVFSWNVNETLTDMAEYRAFDAETPIGAGQRGERKSSELAALGLKLKFGEYDQLRRMGANSPESVQAAAERLGDRVAMAAVYRLVLLRAEAVLSGGLAINENEFEQNVDFGRDASLTDAAPASGLWSTADADPIADLQAFMEAVEDASGVTPDVAVMSTRVFSALTAALAGSQYVTTDTGTISHATVNTLLSEYGLPQARIENGRIAGRRIFPDDRIVMAPLGGVAGGTPWGTTVESMDPRYGLASVGLPGLVVGAYRTDDPDVKWIRSNGIGLPILSNPDTTLSAKVL